MIKKIIAWAKRNSKTLLYILILIVGISIMHSLFKKDVDIQTSTIIDYTEVQKWKDKYNNEHNTVVQLQLDKKQFRREADSIAELLKVKPKNISSITSVTTKGEVIIKEKLTYIDSLKSFGFSKKDNYLALKGLVNRENDSVNIQINTYDTLTIVPYKKTKFFKETFAVDVTNKNPYNKIVSGYSYSQTQRIKRWGIGPQVGYDPINQRVTYGIGLQYNIIRF